MGSDESHLVLVPNSALVGVRRDEGPPSDLAAEPLAELASDIEFLYRLLPVRGFDYVSPSAARITGYSPAEHYADPDLLLKISHPEDRATAAVLLHGPSEPAGPVPLRLIRKDGGTAWTEYFIAPIHDVAGRVVAVEGLARDVTEQRAAQEQLRVSEASGRLAAARTQAIYEQLQRVDEERRRLLETLGQVERKERKQLSEDLHDDPVQVITAAVLRIQLLRRRDVAPEHRAELVALEEILQLAVRRLRRLSFELRPASLEDEGLAAVLRSVLEPMREETGLRYRIRDHLQERPPTEVGMTIYRIAREALVNVRKHARARNVDVLLAPRDGGYFLRIRDDGEGFEAREPARVHQGHLGFQAMRERAELAGGWWRIDSAPGAGTVVECWVPASVNGTDR
ncbi:MAG: PAS domain-containing protein [Actinomycetota bacterium]|nr:PAS domain-containing protein [Actinomycetota bacterium]